MATTTASDGLQNSGVQNSTTRGVDDSSVIRIFQLASSLGILVFLGFLIVSERANLDGSLPEIALWAAVALAADLMLVRVGKGVTLTMSLPVSLAAALLFAPGFAAIVAFAGCLDPMEVRGESSVSRAIFNRAQVALATTAAAFVFRTEGCADSAKAQISGTAEGIVKGARSSAPLNVTQTSRPGVYAVYPSWPAEGDWVALNTILEERTVRDLIPRLKAAGAEGIVEYPLNKIVM